MTTTAAAQSSEPLLANPIQIQASSEFSAQDDAWEEVISLVDPALEATIAQMQSEISDVPEVGYDLADAQGKVIACAELAWVDAKVAIVLSIDDLQVFQEQGWYAVEVDECLTSLARLKSRLSGGT